jgi:hypothetical protein
MTQNVPDYLVRRPHRPFNPYAHWHTYKDIIFVSDDMFDRWDVHPRGILMESRGTLSVDGAPIYKPKTDDYTWYQHAKGFLIREKNKFLINGEELIYEGEWDDWRSHPRGVIVQRGNQLILNMQRVVYEGEISDWACHPNGIVMQKGSFWIFYSV